MSGEASLALDRERTCSSESSAYAYALRRRAPARPRFITPPTWRAIWFLKCRFLVTLRIYIIPAYYISKYQANEVGNRTYKHRRVRVSCAPLWSWPVPVLNIRDDHPVWSSRRHSGSWRWCYFVDNLNEFSLWGCCCWLLHVFRDSKVAILVFTIVINN